MIDPATEQVSAQVVAALQRVFGDKLEAVVLHGSAAKGGYIPYFSDFDFVVFHHGSFSYKEALALQKAMGRVNPLPFAYLQASQFINLDRSGSLHTAALVPGGYHIIYGFLPTGALYTKDDLREKGREWLESLPEMISTDLKAWSVATGTTRSRLIRVGMTRLLPALRAMLVQHGRDPVTVWSASLPKLIKLCDQQIPYLASRLDQVAKALPGTDATETIIGNEIYSMLVDITLHYRRTQTPPE